MKNKNKMKIKAWIILPFCEANIGTTRLHIYLRKEEAKIFCKKDDYLEKVIPCEIFIKGK